MIDDRVMISGAAMVCSCGGSAAAIGAMNHVTMSVRL